jgi:hypothetical protein
MQEYSCIELDCFGNPTDICIICGKTKMEKSEAS